MLLADKPDTVTAAVTEVLAANPDATLFDIEMAFRDAGARAYVIAGPELTIVLGMRAWRAALGRAGVSPEENRAALAGTTYRPPRLLAAAIAINPQSCEFVPTHLPSSGRENTVAEAQAMTQPAKRIPRWLRTDLLVIVVSLAIISIWIWIGP